MIVIDHGFEDFFRELDQLVGKEVAVGIHDAEVAECAAYNEFGTVGVPQRSFMRSTFDAEQDNVISMFSSRFNQTQSLIEAAQDTGDIFAYLIKMKIEGGDFTPNAPSTIRAKGHNRPLINTGRMKDSIKSVMRGSR